MTSDEKVIEVVQYLQSSCLTIEAEIQQINADIEHAQQSMRRYGDVYMQPLRYLSALRDSKKNRYHDIVNQLEALKAQFDNTSVLLSQLSSGPDPMGVNVTLLKGAPQ